MKLGSWVRNLQLLIFGPFNHLIFDEIQQKKIHVISPIVAEMGDECGPADL